MKITLTHHFPGIDPDQLNEVWSNPEVVARITRALPNVQEREVLEENHDDNFMRRKVRYLGKAPIPSFAQAVLKPEMLSWIEDTVYDKKKRTYRVKCIPRFFSDRVENDVTIRLVSDGRGGTDRITEGVLNLKIPFMVRSMAEKILNRHLNENTEAEYRLLRQEVENFKKSRKG